MENIPQRKVRKYIAVSREIDQLQDLTLIHPVAGKEINESNYNVNEKIFFPLSKHELSKVWESYRHANLLKNVERTFFPFRINSIKIFKFSNIC